jgi:SpoIID/LytB domain protein
MRNAIYSSNDSTLMQEYDNWIVLKRQIVKGYSNGGSVSMLEEQADSLETYLVKNSNEFSDFKNTQNISWQQVQAGLKENEVAIEFTHFPLLNPDSSFTKFTNQTQYVALILTKNSKPQMIPLFKEKQLEQIIGKFGGNNYSWTKKIALSSWKAYLKRNGFRFNNSQVKGEDFIKKIYSRRKYYVFKKDSIPFTRIRKAFKLKSAFFSIDYKDGYITLRGKGYGHGVGLSQEGAMKMSNKGYNYKEIIKFYYKNVFIVSLRALQFFNM